MGMVWVHFTKIVIHAFLNNEHGMGIFYKNGGYMYIFDKWTWYTFQKRWCMYVDKHTHMDV